VGHDMIDLPAGLSVVDGRGFESRRPLHENAGQPAVALLDVEQLVQPWLDVPRGNLAAA